MADNSRRMAIKKRMHSLAHKTTSMESVAPSKHWYPSMHLSTEELPILKGKSVGDTLILRVEAKITSKTSRTPGKTTFDLDLLKAGEAK